jgi:Dyp-type peroxidase family
LLELSEIQAIVTSGLGHLPHARFQFLAVSDRKAAQAWLAAITPQIEASTRRPQHSPKPNNVVQVALTAPGLLAFGLTQDAMQTFPREFMIGMADPERSKVLGDSGESAPEHWQIGGSASPEMHLLLLIYASSAEHMREATARYLPDVAAAGMKELFRQETYRDSVAEPFGFRDGISQPAIDGAPAPVMPGQSVIKPGEFLLGYENEYGQQPPMPTVAQEQDVANVLAADPHARGRKSFGRNGTFLVVRKLAQDVAGFWAFVDQQARRPDGAIDAAKRELFAAKLVGRWRSGAPLTLAAVQDDPALGKDARRNDDFLYMPTDAEGFACPVGSHTRRSNPRDTQPPNPTRSLVITNRHRVLRRARPYREYGQPPSTGDAGAEVGLVFMCINADIQRQFEFVQQTWINNPKFNGLYDNKDPLIGDNNATPIGSGSMTIQRSPVRQKVDGIPRFVVVKGGGYFFLPAISALRFLARLP